MEKAEAEWYDHNSSKIGKILKKDHSFTFKCVSRSDSCLCSQVHVCVHLYTYATHNTILLLDHFSYFMKSCTDNS